VRLVLLLLTGCWSSTQVAPAPAAEPAVVIESGPSGSVGYRPPTRHTFPTHSVWEGTYVCSQGLSAVRFTIDATRTGDATAEYDFGPTPSNTSVPQGAYTMKGQLHATARGFTAELEPDEWLVHPPGYLMVSLTLVAEGNEMTGTISHPNCSQFQTRRVD
jgi:hypothetical protein